MADRESRNVFKEFDHPRTSKAFRGTGFGVQISRISRMPGKIYVTAGETRGRNSSGGWQEQDLPGNGKRDKGKAALARRLRQKPTMKPKMTRPTLGDGQLNPRFEPVRSQEKAREFKK